MADLRIKDITTTADASASDDYFAIDGATSDVRKLSAYNPAFNDVLFGDGGPSVKSSIAARAPSQGLVFDGTAGATFANTTTFGSGNLTVSLWVRPTAFAAIQTLVSGAANAFGFRLTTAGKLSTTLVSTADNTDSTGTLTAGEWTHVAYTKDTSLGTPGTYYINGIAAGTTADARNYSVASTTLGGTGGGASFLTGTISQPLIYNRALSAAEVLALATSGRPAAADFNSASNTSLLTAGQSAMDVGTWTAVGGATVDGQGHLGADSSSSLYINNLVAKGRKYKITGTIVSGSVLKLGWSVTPDITIASATGAFSYEFTTRTDTTGAESRLGLYSTDSAVIDNINVYAIGLLLAPDTSVGAGAGTYWYDTSANSATITRPASGTSWALPWSGYLTGPTGADLTIGSSAGKNITVSPGTAATGVFSYTGTLDATATTAAGFKVASGMGIAKALWVGGLANVAGNLTVSGTGTHSFAGLVSTTASSAGTNDTIEVLKLGRATSGTAANNLGGFVQMLVEDDSGTQREAGVLKWKLTSVASGSPAGWVALGTRGSNDALVLDNAGNLTVSGTGTHTFGTTNTVTMAAGALTAHGSTASFMLSNGATAIDTTPNTGSSTDGLSIQYNRSTGEIAYMGFSSAGSTYTTFYTNTGGAASVERMRISDTGATTFSGSVSASGTAATWTSGTGSPEGAVTAPVGSLYTRTDGSTSTTLYVKESGASNTGWVAK